MDYSLQRVCATSMLCALCLGVPDADAQKMYWTNQTDDTIQRADLDGGNLEDLITNEVEEPFGVVFDQDAGKMYWTDRGTGAIQRANLDGSAIESLVLAGITTEVELALDQQAGKMYWAAGGDVRRADLDGANVEDLVTGLNRPGGVGLDLATGKMYWHDAPTIFRANLDGSDVEGLVATSAVSQTPVAFDFASGKMYWAVGFVGGVRNKIQRADLDGANFEDLLVLDTVGSQLPDRITLDIASGKMYWAETLPGIIRRANLDGSALEDLVTGSLSEPRSLTLEAQSGKMYWADRGGPSGDKRIQRADLDGSDVEDLVVEGLLRPGGLALDPGVGRMYWTDSVAGKIQRASLDGDDVEDLVARVLSVPSHIAIDHGASKMYWTDPGTDRIQRANLDGSGYELLIDQGLTSPGGIALDSIAGKMYWTDGGAQVMSGRIQRSNLDGSNIEDVIAGGLNFPSALALDVASGRMYWLEPAGIRRAGLDGAGVEDVIAVNARTFAIDPVGGQMFWSLDGLIGGSGTIQRSDLDGAGVTDVAFRSAGGIYLDVGARRMYWTVMPGKFNIARVMRADMDGANAESLLPMPASLLRGIALDVPPVSLVGTGLAFGDPSAGFDSYVDVVASVPFATPVGPVGSEPGAVKDVAVDPTTGLVYAIGLAPDAQGQQVYVIDSETGEGTPLPLRTGIAEPGLVWGLAFDAAGSLYGGGLGVYSIDKKSGRAFPLASVAEVPALILGMTESPVGTGFLSAGVILIPELPLPFVALHTADGAFASLFLQVDPSGKNRILFDLAYSAGGSLYGNAWSADLFAGGELASARSNARHFADFNAALRNVSGEEIELEARRRVGPLREKLELVEDSAGMRSDLVLIDFTILDGLPLAHMSAGAPLDALLLGLGGGFPSPPPSKIAGPPVRRNP